MADTTIRIIPLGGLGEIGKNMMVVEVNDDIVVVDCGVMFPEQDMLGIDLVIPDVKYLIDNIDRVRGIVITHGHEDHIGALPYILPLVNVPVYCTRLTHGLISVKLQERGLHQKTELVIVQAGGAFRLGELDIEFFHVNHSIPDAVGIIIHTPLGAIVHTGDFKVDFTPVDGQVLDMARLSEIGTDGCLLLMSDSTYAEVPGYTASEQVVGVALERIIAEAEGRVIIACFASLIARIQQIVDASVKHGRKVMVLGRSMSNNVQMSIKLGYLEAPPGTFINGDELKKLPPNKVTIIATGSQGEPTSVLARIASNDHRQVRIIPGDTVVLSSTPIPGNEELVARTVDNLFRLGAKVLYSAIALVHVHGHASQEELKLILSLTQPDYFVPVHGEYRHLVLHAQLSHKVGVPVDNAFVMVDGDVLEITETGAAVIDKVPTPYVYVDGFGVADIGNVVLRDRKSLSRDGIVMVVLAIDRQSGQVVGRPEVVSRGFVEQESDDLLERTRDVAARSVEALDGMVEWGLIMAKVKDAVGRYLYEQTRRRPMIIPVPVEV